MPRFYPARHIEITPETNGNLFFWHFQNQHIANKQRTVIWLNGGPGCSSEDGALMEIGPYRVNDDLTLSYNEGSWSEFANLLFVDNPVGTGYSFVSTNSYVTELTEMANQFVTFLEKYFAIFPEYEQDDVSFGNTEEWRALLACLCPCPSTLTLSRFTLPANLTQASIYPTSPRPSSTATRNPPQDRHGT